MPQVLGEAGTMTGRANAGARGAPPRRGIGDGGVIGHGRVVRGDGAAHMCRAGIVFLFESGFHDVWSAVLERCFLGVERGGRGGVDVAHVRAGDD